MDFLTFYTGVIATLHFPSRKQVWLIFDFEKDMFSNFLSIQSYESLVLEYSNDVIGICIVIRVNKYE